MTRARAVWLGAVVVILAAAGYLLRRRSRRLIPVPSAPPIRPPATAQVEPIVATTEEPVINEPAPTQEVAPVHTEPTVTVEPTEQPLPTWVRVAIVAAALLAFFAVSLIATKQV